MKKYIITILTLIIIDVLVIRNWIFHINPDPSMGIIGIYVMVAVFIGNIIVAAIIYFLKKYFVPFFIVNAFISSIIFLYFWGYITEKNMHKPDENWSFYIHNMEYKIKYRPVRTYSLYNITSKYCGNIVINESGAVCLKNDTIYFSSIDS